MAVDRQSMEAQLVLHEGLRLTPYLDTEGNLTCLVGYNVTARGWDLVERVLGRRVGDPPAFTRGDALRVLGADLDRLEAAVPVHWAYYARLDEIRQRVVLDMAFNMGLSALGFRNAIACAERRDWSGTAREMYKSKWSRQVGDGPGGKRDRCDRLAQMVLTGQEPTDVPPLYQ